MPKLLVEHTNITAMMLKKCPSLFVGFAEDAIKSLLYERGVKEIYSYKFQDKGMKKIYFGFVV